MNRYWAIRWHHDVPFYLREQYETGVKEDFEETLLALLAAGVPESSIEIYPPRWDNNDLTYRAGIYYPVEKEMANV